MFAVLVTGPPGAGKTATMIALADALADDGIAHAAVDATPATMRERIVE